MKESKVYQIGFALLIIALVCTLILSIYESVTSSENAVSGFLKEPEVIAIAVGLVITILFVERWRSMEGKLEKLTSDQLAVLKNIREFSESQIDEKVKKVTSKAESLNTSVLSLEERHPWLQVITEREFIIECEGIRGVLTTCHALLSDENFHTLYEYLEFCSKKQLKGTVDDFIELADFCEIWLGDYYLASIFLSMGGSRNAVGSLILPEILMKQIRIGDLNSAHATAKGLEKTIKKNGWFSFKKQRPISEKFIWRANNTISCAHAYFGDRRKYIKFHKQAQKSCLASEFQLKQLIYDIDAAISFGEFDDARSKIEVLTESSDPAVISEVSHFFARIGDFELSTFYRNALRELLISSFVDASEYPDDDTSPSEERTREPSPTREPARSTEPDKDKNASIELDGKPARER